MPAHAGDDSLRELVEVLLRGHGLLAEQPDDLVQVGRDGRELIRGRIQRRHHGERRRRRSINQCGEVRAVGEAAGSGACGEPDRNAPPQPDRDLDRLICGRIRFMG